MGAKLSGLDVPIAPIHRIDVVGDVHGQLDALLGVLADLGYEKERDWAHPDGRVLVFLGDLVDRGPQSLEVVQLVAQLRAHRRAHCLMGNHEFNLLESWVEGKRARGSNKDTLADIRERPEAWEAQLPFLAALPLAIELPGLRLVHACWHIECVRLCRQGLAPQVVPASSTQEDTWAWVKRHISLESPFTPTGRKERLPAWGRDGSHNTCAEVLIKGFEEPVDPKVGKVVDPDGGQWSLQRVTWWLEPERYGRDVATDLPVVFGHFWHMPPRAAGDATAPRHLVTAPGQEAARRSDAASRPGRGRLALGLADRFLCVDFNGMVQAGRAACIGAYRWPEHELVWNSAGWDSP
ncbi:MAG: metallophosphoesterase [Deltaproteobacteria bacterium]|nr:metallophosphoesterase [Deltaproteobacteria bacterium]